MACQILSFNPALEFNPDLIRNILTDKNLHKLKVAIISIAGPYRNGKSFLLNFFIRYLRRKRSPDWLHTDVPRAFDGFEWKDCSYNGIYGVLLWPEPFIVDDVAVFLMDTQGSFNKTVLALTTMVSTVTIYNVDRNLPNSDLDFLYFSTELGKSVLQSEDSYGAGKVVVLVRDCIHGAYLDFDNFLRGHIPQAGESLRTSFLVFMPEQVTGRRKTLFARQLDQLDKEFLSCLGKLIPEIVDGVVANAVLHTGPEVFRRFVTCFGALENMSPVSVKTAHDFAVKGYIKVMCTIIGVDGVRVDPKLLQEAHENAMGRAVRGFQSRPRMGGNVGGNVDGVQQLERDLELLGRNFARTNEGVGFGQVLRKVVVGFASGGVTGALRAIAGCDVAIVVPCVCLAVGVGLIAVNVAVFVVCSESVSHDVLSTLLTSAASRISEFVTTEVLGSTLNPWFTA